MDVALGSMKNHQGFKSSVLNNNLSFNFKLWVLFTSKHLTTQLIPPNNHIIHIIIVPFNAVVLGIGHLQASTINDDQHEVLHMMDTSSTAMVEILNNVLDMGEQLFQYFSRKYFV